MATRRENVMGLITGMGISALVGILALVVMPGRAQADSVTFLFNCSIAAPSGSTCNPGGPFGSVTLTDNANRVDIAWNLTPGFGNTLERMLLNWTGPIAGHHFELFPQVNGDFVQLGDNIHSLGQFRFDLRVSPQSGALVFAGSLGFFDGNTPVDIDVADFLTTSGGTGTPVLFAGYRTTSAGGGLGEFFAGAPGTPIPEPASLLLLGTGLVGLAARRRAAIRKASAASIGV